MAQCNSKWVRGSTLRAPSDRPSSCREYGMLVCRGWLDIEGEDHARDVAELGDLNDDDEWSDDENSVDSDPDWDPESGDTTDDDDESDDDDY